VIAKALKENAKRGPAVLGTVQLNREASRGDPLAAYKVPLVDAIQGGKAWEQGADVVLGAYRPLIGAWDKKLEAEWRLGQRTLRDILEPNAVNLACLKHRVDGAAKGELMRLRWDRGRITDPQTEDRVAYETRHDL
jgi:hypothetical protein